MTIKVSAGRVLFSLVIRMAVFFGSLNLLALLGEATVLVQGLGAELDPVHEEDDLVGVLGIGDELGRLEAGHGFA